jgi:hypothetical protein
MNERIRELVEQCHHRYSEHHIDLEKFAELIVKECVTVAMRAVSDDEPKEAWYLIKEHFGVEE